MVINQELFPEPAPKPVDTEAIAASSSRYEPEDRTSEAARDQGWGPVNLPARPQALKPAVKIPASDAFEGDQLPHYHAPVELSTPEEIARGKQGIAEARQILDQTRDKL